MTSTLQRQHNPIAHLGDQEREKLAKELDAIHDEVFADLGERDRHYIKTVISVERQIVVLHDMAGLTHAEVAAELELPAGTVRWRYRVALARLRPLVQEEAS